MATPAETVTRTFLQHGIFDIIIFAMVAAIVYAVLRKTKILGDSPVVAGIISLGVAFLIFGYPIITGTGSILVGITSFFTQVAVIGLVLLVGFLLASFFYPDLQEFLRKTFIHRSVLSIMIALGFVLLVTSGLISVIWDTLTGPSDSLQPGGEGGSGRLPQNVYIFIAGIVLFVVMIIIAAGVVRSSE